MIRPSTDPGPECSEQPRIADRCRRPPPLPTQLTPTVVNVIFFFTSRQTDIADKHFTRVDVIE
jgi:hypothetical protein